MSRPKPAHTSGEDAILTVATLAQYLRCSPGTIYRMLSRGQLPAFKIGSDWRFFKAEIDNWVRQSTAWTKPRP
jgi:excisionase family DNA binding protein